MCDERATAKISHEAYGNEVTISFCAGSNPDEYMDYIERLLIAAGFHPESVKAGFIAKVDKIEENLHSK